MIPRVEAGRNGLGKKKWAAGFGGGLAYPAIPAAV